MKYSAIMFCFVLAAFLSSAFCQTPADKFFADQVEPNRLEWDFSSYKYTLPTAFLSGASDGLNQVLNTHYGKFKSAFPKANDQFWNPETSWRNKYAKTPDGQVLTQYEAFPFSTTALVFVTDGHHLTRAGDHVFMLATVTLNIGQRKNWKHYAVDFLAHSFARSAGFNTVYHIVF